MFVVCRDWHALLLSRLFLLLCLQGHFKPKAVIFLQKKATVLPGCCTSALHHPGREGTWKALNLPLCCSGSPRRTVGFPGNFHKAEWYLLKTKAFCWKSWPWTMNTQAVHPDGQAPSPCWVDSHDNRSWPSSFLSAHLTPQSPPPGTNHLTLCLPWPPEQARELMFRNPRVRESILKGSFPSRGLGLPHLLPCPLLLHKSSEIQLSASLSKTIKVIQLALKHFMTVASGRSYYHASKAFQQGSVDPLACPWESGNGPACAAVLFLILEELLHCTGDVWTFKSFLATARSFPCSLSWSPKILTSCINYTRPSVCSNTSMWVCFLSQWLHGFLYTCQVFFLLVPANPSIPVSCCSDHCILLFTLSIT